MIDTFRELDPRLQALIAGLFTWAVTALGAAAVFLAKRMPVQLLDAMLFLWERMKIVVEPTGALAAAALFERKIDYKSGARIGVIVSGGNVDVRAACALIRARDARKQGGAA